MRKISILVGVMVVLMLSVVAQEVATPKEAVQKCKDAVALIKAEGDGAFAKINNKNGAFVWKDSYVFVIDMSGVTVAHPMRPTHIGQNMMATKDVKGKMFFAEFVKLAKTKGEGWVEYHWENPVTKKVEVKVSYIMKVNDKYIVGAGVHNYDAAGAEKAVK